MARETSSWVYVGIGCLVVSLIIATGIGVVGYYTYKQVKHIEATVKDPEARTAAARRVLGTAQIPEGYHVMVAFEVPLLMDFAMLSDREPDPKGEIDGFDERGFIYVEMLSFGDKRRELEEFAEGKRDDTDALREHGVRIRRGDLMARGEVELVGGRGYWVAHRGGVGSERRQDDGLATMTLVRCEKDDQRLRLGIWFGPDPDKEAAPEEAKLEGTVADPERLREFLRAFTLCPAAQQ